MSGMSELPILSSAPDQLRHGITALPAGAVAAAVHPVQLIEQNFARQQDANQKSLLARVYGTHLPMKLHLEQVRHMRHALCVARGAVVRDGSRRCDGRRELRWLFAAPLQASRPTDRWHADRTRNEQRTQLDSAERGTVRTDGHMRMTPCIH